MGLRERYTNWIPHGFDYFNPDESERLIGLIHKMRGEFQGVGYREIIPPMLDFSRTFQITTRHASESPLFETRDSDGEALAFRSDLTVQVVKAAASGRIGSGGSVPVQKFCYFQPVLQDCHWGSGRRREVIQAGVELIGDPSGERAASMIDLARRTLTSSGFTPHILYGDVRFLNSLFAGVPENIRSILSEAFYLKDTGRIAEISSGDSMDPALAHLLVELPLIFGGSEALAELKTLCAGREDLLSILRQAEAVPGVIYDFSLVRELSYYTGPVFEAYVPQSKTRVLTGGVYDDLYRRFSGRDRTACGFALNLTILSENLKS